MGTRADFYIGRGECAEWLGSIALDGYLDGIEKAILSATSEQEFRDAVFARLTDDTSGTFPEMGWPWPWEDSRTTDYAYAFDGGRVWASSFGHEWFNPNLLEPEWKEKSPKSAVFPDMSKRQKVTFGDRSGLFVIGLGGIEE